MRNARLKALIRNPLLLFVGAVLLDQIAKALVRVWRPDLLISNSGLAFSAAQFQWTRDLAAIAGLIIAIVFWRAKHKTWWAALFAAGAFSNSLDRIFGGQVTDYIHYPWGITGNLADIFLAVGIIGGFWSLRRIRT